MSVQSGWLERQSRAVHITVMQYLPWMTRNSGMTPDARPIKEIVEDFLNCNAGKGFIFEALLDHVSAIKSCRWAPLLDRAVIINVVDELLAEHKINKVGEFYTSLSAGYMPA